MKYCVWPTQICLVLINILYFSGFPHNFMTFENDAVDHRGNEYFVGGIRRMSHKIKMLKIFSSTISNYYPSKSGQIFQ